MTDMDRTTVQVASALLDEAERQQAVVAELIKRLDRAVTGLEKSKEQLPAALAHQVNAKLSEAARQAAAEIASNWTEANTHAQRATQAYRDEASWAPRKIMLINLAAIVLGVLAMVAVAWCFLPDEGRLLQLRAEQAQLEENIRLLEARGGKAQVRSCLDTKGKAHVCVRVQDSPTYGDGFRIVRP